MYTDMGLIKNAKFLIGQKLLGSVEKDFPLQSPQQDNLETGLVTTGSNMMRERQAIYPNWFFSARLGQPRGIKTNDIREQSRSCWVQMVLNAFKKQVKTIPWDIVTEDENDDISKYEDDVKKIKDFLNKINDNDQDITDIISEALTDNAEIDSGVWNFIYDKDSYEEGEIPIYNQYGEVTTTEKGMVIKPLGQRNIRMVKCLDGSSFLKQVDLHKNLLQFWQYSFRHARQNPTLFYKEEIVYMIMNQRSYDIYGFSPVQSIQQVIEVLVQGTRYNKDLYRNNAIPDILVSLPKMPEPELKKLKRRWNNRYKGKPHQLGFINWAIENIHKLVESNRDLEWLDGQKWYHKIVFGVFGVSPTEAGFFENSNKSNDEGQERITIRNALKPYLDLYSKHITKRLITEILQKEDHGLKYKYFPKSHAEEKVEFEQSMKELEEGALTINEYRQMKGKKDVDWGDEPYKKQSNIMNNFEGGEGQGQPGQPPGQPPEKPTPSSENAKAPAKKNLDIIEEGEEIVEEADGYSDFLERTFDLFEKKTLRAVTKLDLNKSYMEKTVGQFISDMFNSVNTVLFAKHVKKFMKADLVKGLASAEAELNMDIGYNQVYEQKVNQLSAQQIDGYSINGKKWHGIKGATKELQSDIIRIVQDGVQEGKTRTEIKEAISGRFDKFSDWRSNMIARTETNRVINEGKLIGYKEAGLDGGKIPLVAMDDRTSPICKRISAKYGNKAIPLDDPFIDPETHKEFLTPPFHPNCRTTIGFRAK